jgi:hypothetical protein
MATGSHGVDSRIPFKNHFRRELLPTSSTPPSAESSFPIRSTQDRLTLWCRECVTDNPRKGQRRFRRFRRCTRVFLQGSDPFLPAVRESKWRREPPTWLIAAFIAWSRLTLSTMRLHAFQQRACLPPFRNHMSFQKGLRLKHIMHFSFGIILKYYFQGLSPLGSTLSPFLTFQPLIPYPFCGRSVPLHSFIVVGLHLAVFIFY